MIVFAMRESELLDFFNAHRRQIRRNQGDGKGFVTLMRFNCEKQRGAALELALCRRIDGFFVLMARSNARDGTSKHPF
jgi:hypothetical protein